MNPLSRSSTATRKVEEAPPDPDGVAPSLAMVVSVIAGGKSRDRAARMRSPQHDVTGCSQGLCATREGRWTLLSPLQGTSAPVWGPAPWRELNGWEESENSRKRPVTTNATCSPMSTALSPIRSSARATKIFIIATEIGDDPDTREWAMLMILVARALERIGDNAVDIGEQVAFVVTGLFREFSDSSHPFSSRHGAGPQTGADVP